MHPTMAIDYAVLFRACSTPMALADSEGCLLDANDAWLASLHVLREQALGRSLVQLGLWPDAPSWVALQQQLRQGGEVRDFEATLRVHTEARPHRIHLRTLSLSQGSAVLWELHDQTGIQRTEKALWEITRDFESFLDRTGDYIHFKDLHGRYRFCSQMQADVMGVVNWRDMRGKRAADVVSAELAAIYEADERKVLQTQQPILNLVNPYQDASGRPGFTQTNRWPLFDQQGRIAGMFGIARDITERLQLQAALRESERKQHAMSHNAPRAIQVFAPDGQLLRANPVWERLWSVRQQDLGAYNLLTDPQLQTLGVLDALRPVFAGETVNLPVYPYQRLHLPPEHPDSAQTLWLQVCAYPVLADDGTLLEVVLVQEDVSAAVSVQQGLERQKAKLEEMVAQRTQELHEALHAAQVASVAKSAFLANMSHEIRTPLNAITGMAHLIRRGGLTPVQSSQMDKLQQAGAHLLGTLNAVLDLSKIEAGKFTLEESSLHVEAVVGNVLSMLQERAAAKGLQLRSELVAFPKGLVGDATCLQQCLINYASNAIKFTEGGHVTLRALVQEDTPHSALLRFEVDDTGIGLDEALLPRLFLAFEQADNSTTRKYGGTGLGLAITRKLAQLMGGDAGAHNLPQGGSRFWFSARLGKDVAAHAGPAHPAHSDAEGLLQRHHGGRRILVVDDEPVNQEIARIVLEDLGLVVDVAEDGAQAVHMARSGDYDLVLMDMQMPVMDGLRATQTLRQIPESAVTPIVAMTANAFSEDKARCLAAGMNDFVTKPVVPSLLYATLLKWLPPVPV